LTLLLETIDELKTNTYNSTYGIDNIWWKLYTWYSDTVLSVSELGYTVFYQKLKRLFTRPFHLGNLLS
jgi:hypothetical protein